MSTFLGALIKARRQHLKMSLEKLAAKAGYSPTTVRKAEMGEKVPAQTLADLAQAVGLEAVRK